jgi:alternate signal-mediated exported protein
MNKTTKGAIAAGSAAVLLLGGASTLAYWSDSAVTDGADIDSGHLDLTPDACTSDWVLDGGATYTTQLLVPGDQLTKTCTYTMDIAGAHFTKADFTVTAPADVTGAAALVDEIGVTTVVERNGDPQATATGVTVSDGDTITVDMTIAWPYGVEDNDSNVVGGLEAALDAVTVVVKQNHS